MLGVGKRFCGLRKKSGLTQVQVAEYLGVDQSYISKCEKGERQFSVDVLEKAAPLLGCSVEYLTDGVSEFVPMSIALRAGAVTAEDLATLAALNKIALNLRFMDSLLGEG
ncbi:MAG: helix-turn-helix transcriptional regulator [Firmicutes bacterium]|nr:helix-turn-helix transcriptional regulator [Bacillota bacterium]